MDIKIIETWHPKLIGKNYKIIESTNLSDYNCIAYSLDIFDMWCGSSEKSWAKQYEHMWRSKLGVFLIIEHKLEWISGFDNKNYGNIGAILKRKL